MVADAAREPAEIAAREHQRATEIPATPTRMSSTRFSHDSRTCLTCSIAPGRADAFCAAHTPTLTGSATADNPSRAPQARGATITFAVPTRPSIRAATSTCPLRSAVSTPSGEIAAIPGSLTSHRTRYPESGYPFGCDGSACSVIRSPIESRGAGSETSAAAIPASLLRHATSLGRGGVPSDRPAAPAVASASRRRIRSSSDAACLPLTGS